ncbi:MAG: hypothetical protein IKV25_00260 [Clostridia bacterium]|nr:hypothetical protein [Clostridia bacterium]
MAQQNRNAYAYNYNRNERVVSYNGSAAPKVKPQPQKKPQLELVQKTRLTAAQIRQQTAVETRKTFKVMCIAMVVVMFMALAIYSRVKLDEINREISSVEKKIELAQSDAVKLNNELNAIVSINNVEEYATNELGMTKIQDYQVYYIDMSSEDYVAVANGESVARSINNNGK